MKDTYIDFCLFHFVLVIKENDNPTGDWGWPYMTNPQLTTYSMVKS